MMMMMITAITITPIIIKYGNDIDNGDDNNNKVLLLLLLLLLVVVVGVEQEQLLNISS